MKISKTGKNQLKGPALWMKVVPARHIQHQPRDPPGWGLCRSGCKSDREAWGWGVRVDEGSSWLLGRCQLENERGARKAARRQQSGYDYTHQLPHVLWRRLSLLPFHKPESKGVKLSQCNLSVAMTGYEPGMSTSRAHIFTTNHTVL